MRHLLISTLLLSLIAGCSNVNIGPHRIDVQQGNALDQENVARLKPGLNRSQVRFLLGTPLVVDPFRTDRWDYVYMYYRAGKLTEQKRISLFFEGDTLVRIEGDLPQPAIEAPASAPAAAAKPAPKAEPAVIPAATETHSLPEPPPPQATPLTQPSAPAARQSVEPAAQRPAEAKAQQPVQSPAQQPVEAKVQTVKEPPVSQPDPVASAAQPAPEPVPRPAPAVAVSAAPATATTIVSPLPSPKDAPAYVDKRPPAELSLQPETDVQQIRPNVIPPFPGVDAAPAGQDEAVFKAVNAWVQAWGQRDEEAYIAAYDSSFVPQGGDSRAEWEKRRRLLLGVANNIDVRIEALSVERLADGTAVATFEQYYRADNYRDAVVKQLRLVERNGRWLIVEEKVVSPIRGSRP